MCVVIHSYEVQALSGDFRSGQVYESTSEQVYTGELLLVTIYIGLGKLLLNWLTLHVLWRVWL